ncbi:hypothetical protein L6452_41925 [Arctium lappa]|uniref:Uncharacterized protein n=1 Tax=Arctium lappa TaxID=4217 RepID=A0ACB8XIM0_ARCLA|nr:hypothetical protein L6452_41925 [Arctium lappa]
MVNEIQRSPFAETRSSPELTETYNDVPFQAELLNHTGRSSGDDLSSVSHALTHLGFDASDDSNSGSSLYQRDPGLHSMSEEISSNVGAQGMHQEESSRLRGVHRHRTRASVADVGWETVGLKDGGLTGTKSSSGCSRNRRRSCRETCGRRSVDMDDNMYSTTFTVGILLPPRLP